MIRRLAMVAATSAMLFGTAPVPAAAADPICNAPGLPPCAPPAPFQLTPAQTCAVVAWRTWVPCNWWGQQVPEGTPGSVG